MTDPHGPGLLNTFEPPKGYAWLLQQHMVGFEAFSQLQPWYYLDQTSVFEVRRVWPNGPYDGDLVAFARRQDNDDIACFHVLQGNVQAIMVIHGWTTAGYAVVQTYPTFWDWLKAVVDDIAEWVESTH